MDRVFALVPHVLRWDVAAIAGGATALAGVAALGTPAGTLVAALGMAGLAGVNLRLQRRLASAARRIEALQPRSTAASLERGLDGVERQIAAVQHRVAPAHPVSGLPMREALLARMTADRAGMLGALAFDDFDRLTAFDPVLAERVFAASTHRLTQMLPPGRFLAQVDRGQVGLWFAGEEEAVARAELDAIAYALCDVVEAAGQRVTPRVKLRLACFDAAEGTDAGVLVARTLASFALGKGEFSAGAPQADHAALAHEAFSLEQDLRQAIGRRELRLMFQPLVDAGRGCIGGAEALIRWDHPEHGPVSPARFVPIMEAMGLAGEIGLWALNAAVREARDWAVQGLGQLRVAVNVSALQLDGDDLPILVQRTLQRHELGAAALELELTESVATTDAEHCRRLFQQLRAMGVKLAVDDFGTGYSGFASLRTLAFDKIKIDRQFVTDVDRRRDSQAICQSIIALGRGLGIRVLAEGVERRAEYAWLRRHGCEHFQGYHFGRPMTGEAFAAFVRDPAALAALLRMTPGREQIQERLRA